MEARAEIARLARAMTDRNNNQPPMPSVYPDYPAPIIVTANDGSREMRNLRRPRNRPSTRRPPSAPTSYGPRAPNSTSTNC
jgi:hypothetical protein